MVPGGTRLPRGQGVGVGEQLNFVLRCHPNEASVGRLTREYLRTSSELKVSQLKKFLGRSGTAGALEILVHDPDEDRAVILHNQLARRRPPSLLASRKRDDPPLPNGATDARIGASGTA